MKASVIGNAQFKVYCKVLVCSQIVNDAASLLTVDHVCIEASSLTGGESADPSYRLAIKRIGIRVVLDCEWNIATALREHDASPSSDVEKGKRVWRTMPEFFHDAGAYRGNATAGVQRKSPLDLWMELIEIAPECALIDGGHC